jgi:hypothetical protein
VSSPRPPRSPGRWPAGPEGAWRWVDGIVLIWGALKRWWLPIILNVIAAIIYVAVGFASGLLIPVQTAHAGFFSLFSSNDSVQYHAVADWIFGAGPQPNSLAGRPFLYPLLLGLAERIGGLRGIWLLNVLLWFTLLNVAAAATYRFVKSGWAAAIVFLVLATNASLIVLTFKGLTEITTVALLAVWIYGISHLTRRPTPSQIVWALLPVALLVVVKPQFELLLIVVAVVLIALIVKGPARGVAAVAFVACLVPVAIQLAVNIHFTGYFGISNVGEAAIRGYYLPRLEVFLGQSRTITEGRLRIALLSNAEIVRFVLNHFGDAVTVFFTSLKENLLAGSGFVRNHQRLSATIEAMQAVYFALQLALIPLAAAALWMRGDGRLALLLVGALNVYLAGGITFNQGDRITIIALPLWLLAFVVAFYDVGGGKWEKSLSLRFRATPTGEHQSVSPHR